MPIYQYKAFNSHGKLLSGHIDASSLQNARTQLKKKKLFIKEIKEDTGKRDRQLFPVFSKILYRIPRKEIGLFAGQLGTLIGAGIPIDSALKDLEEQISNVHLQKVVTDIRAKVIEGNTLSEAFANHRDIFPAIYENMIKVGESTGSYEQTLLQLANVEEKNASLRQKTMLAMIYPIAMISIMVIVVLVLMTMVIPNIVTMYEQFGKGMELPLPTEIVIKLSNCIGSTWPYIIGSIIAVSAGFSRYRKTEKGKYASDTWFLKIPLYGKLIRKTEVSRFSRNLAVLIKAGVPILQAMTIVKDSSENEVFRAEIARAQKGIEEGDSLKESLNDSTFIPHIIKGMISAGEASDRLGELVEKGAVILEEEVDTTVKGLSASLEPIIIVVMALVVGGIMAAVLLPMYKMIDLIN